MVASALCKSKARMRVLIYALIDPRFPSQLRYIGKTTQPRARLRKHVRAQGRDRPTHRGKWIKSILADGVEPQMIRLLMVKEKHANAAEREMIKRSLSVGHPLTNGSIGGDGGALMPEAQARATAKIRDHVKTGKIKPPTRPEMKVSAAFLKPSRRNVDRRSG